MLGKMCWKEHASKSSEKRHANTSLRGDATGSLKCVYRCVYKYNIYNEQYNFFCMFRNA